MGASGIYCDGKENLERLARPFPQCGDGDPNRDLPRARVLLYGIPLAGKSVAGLSERELVEVRRRVPDFVFQQFHLLPALTVAENVDLPLAFLSALIARRPGRERRRPFLRR